MTVLVTSPTAGLGAVIAPGRVVRGAPPPGAAPTGWRSYRTFGCGSELGGTADPGQEPRGAAGPTAFVEHPTLSPGT